MKIQETISKLQNTMTIDSLDQSTLSQHNYDMLTYNLFESDITTCLGFRVSERTKVEKELQLDTILEVGVRRSVLSIFPLLCTAYLYERT